MTTLGIDLASQPKDTAACLIDWNNGRSEILELEANCDDALRNRFGPRGGCHAADPAHRPAPQPRGIGTATLLLLLPINMEPFEP